jgi:hypothetical protein
MGISIAAKSRVERTPTFLTQAAILARPSSNGTGEGTLKYRLSLS